MLQMCAWNYTQVGFNWFSIFSRLGHHLTFGWCSQTEMGDNLVFSMYPLPQQPKPGDTLDVNRLVH